MITKQQMQRIKEFAVEKCKNNDMNHDIAHVERTVKLAKLLAKAEGADESMCEAAAWLHDVAQATHHAEHHRVGAEMAREFLKSLSIHNDLVNNICSAILSHDWRTQPEPKTLIEKIVYDADRLQSVGAFGYSRLLAHAIVHFKKNFNEAEKWAKEMEQTRFAQLRTKTAKQLATEPHKLMAKFYESFSRWDKVEGLK